MSYPEYTRKHILQPLRMLHSTFEYEHVPPGRLAKGYRGAGKKWQEEPLLHDGAFGAMGGLLTTMEDFIRYTSLHINAWPPRGGADTGIVSRASLREMQTGQVLAATSRNFSFNSGRPCPTQTHYGYGLRSITDCEGRIFVGHSGGLPGFGSNWTFMPQYGLAVIAFSNRTYAPLSNLNLSVLDTIIRLSGLPPFEPVASSVLLKRQEELVQFLKEPGQGGYSKTFAPNFFLDTPLAEWKKETAALWQKIGKPFSAEVIKPINALRGTFIVRGSSGSARIFLSLSPEGDPRIQQVRITVL